MRIPTIKRGEPGPDKWLAVYRRDSVEIPAIVVKIKMPWRVEMYCVQTDTYELRHPAICLIFAIRATPMTRTFRK